MNGLETGVTAFAFTALMFGFVLSLYSFFRMKAELNRFQERQYILFENIHAPVLIIDPDNGEIADTNDAACKFYGYKKEELLSMNINRINMLDSNTIKEKMQLTLKNEATTRHLFSHKLSDGAIREVEVSSGPINVAGKRLLYSIVADITEIKREEVLQRIRNKVAMLCLDAADTNELLIKSVKIVEEIYGVSECSICIFNDTKGMLEVKAGTEISYEDMERIYNKPIMDKLTEVAYLGSPQYFEEIQPGDELMEPFIKIGFKSIGVIPVKRHDIIVGTLNVASSTLNKLPEEIKHVLQSIAYSIGIAYLRLNSEVCKDEAEDRWKFALEENGDILIDIDYIKERAFTSRYLKKVLGFPEEFEPDILKDWKSNIHAEDLPVLQKAIEEHKQGQLEKILVESRIMTYKGQYKWFLVRGKITKLDDRKKPQRLIVVLTEVTYLKNYEQELLAAKQNVEASSRVKDLFLANISHELRTPMNGIIGMTQLMELSGLSEEQQDNINILKESSSRMMSLINNLISLTSMETGEVSLNESSFDFKNMIDKLFSEYEKEARIRNIELIASIDKDLTKEVIGDAEKLSMVVRQLLDNGIKFTSKGFIKVSVKHIPEKKENGTIGICISVQDTGAGIAEGDIGKLFGSFTQLDDSYTRKYQGAGLGLAICKKLTEILKASIEVESVPGVGSTFSVITEIRTKETASTDNNTKSLKGNVLVVDDDEVSRRLLGMICEKNRLKVQYAVNGRDAVEKCMEHSFDIIFMDIQMPVLSGIDAARLIRSVEYEGRRRPYIIAVTAYALKSDRDRFISEGFDDYISKPIDTGEFIALANKWLLQGKQDSKVL